MKLIVEIDGSVKLEIDRTQVRGIGLKPTLDSLLTPDVLQAVKEVSDQKALEYLNAIGDVSGKPIRELVEPPRIIDLTPPEYEENESDDDDHSDRYGTWNCSNCGAPNSVSRDEGCTSCNF